MGIRKFSYSGKTDIFDSSQAILIHLLHVILVSAFVLTLAAPMFGQDSDQKKARKLLEEAVNLNKKPSPDSLRLALQNLENTLPLFRSAKDQVGETSWLSLLAKTYRNQG